jgi:hypothetical protein
MRGAFPGDFVGGGGMALDANPRAIRDGAWYDLPVLLPGYMRRHMSEDAQAKYLQEADQRTTMRFQFDSPNRSAYDGAIPPVADDPLCEWNSATREQVLSNCHAAYQRHPLAKAAVDYTVGFAVGDGFNVTYHNKDVEALVETFIEENSLRRREKEWLRDLQVDGEIVARLEGAGADMAVLPLRPWELDKIETTNGKPTAYLFKFRDEYGGFAGQPETIPADSILFVPINKHAYELRGRPELYVVLPWLRAYREWLEDRARQNYWRNALLWWVKVLTATPATLAAVLAQWRKPPAPGTVYVGSDKVDVQAVQNTVGASDAGEDGRQMKLAIAAGLRLPEYFFADGANANLASSTSQELPALTKFADFQQVMIEQVWVPLFRMVIEAAIDDGKLASELPMHDADGEPVLDADGNERTIYTLDAFEVSYEPLTSSDPINLAQAITLDLNNGLVSRQTASAERGYDWQREQRLMSMEEQAQARDVNQGLAPRPPEQRPEGLPPDGEGPDEMGADTDAMTPEEIAAMRRMMQREQAA